jgi:hypothetical protein
MPLIREPRTQEAKGHQMRIAAVLASVAQVNVTRGAGARAWPAGAPLQGMGVGARHGHAACVPAHALGARLPCTALREAPEASHASRESRQRVWS